MTTQEPARIDYDSPQAAKLTSVEGWLSADGSFWPSSRADAEHMARYCGCTHMPCKTCGTMVKRNSWCRPCQNKKQDERWAALPREAWDGNSYVTDFDGDRYFSDLGELMDAVSDGEYSIDVLRLLHCEPNYPSQIDPNDYFVDDLPEDGEVPDELITAFEVLNQAIKKSAPLSWSPTKRAVELSAEQLSTLQQAQAEAQQEA